ncbi:NAD(P)/FAD-dependent oxidoreductase [Caldicellulosiruptoraceae bacterium PP1]
MIYDCAVIGSGPAGLSAAINLANTNRKVIVFTTGEDASAIYKAPEVHNYLGFPGINGKELIKNFLEHANKMQIEIVKSKVINFYKSEDIFTINANNNFYEAYSVILAIGMPKKTLLQNEAEFVGRGVSYCAVCDGMLYRGKTIAVIGESVEAEEEAEYLSELAQKVYYVPLYKKESFHFKENVEIINSRPKTVLGEDLVSSLELEGKKVDVSGIFIIRKAMPADQLIYGLEFTDDGHIKVDKNMQTSIEGLFACGDCVGKPYQVAKAVGEGLVAGLAASTYAKGIKEKAK